MKAFTLVIIIAVLAVIALAQRAQNNTDEQLKARNAPDVFVYSASAFGPDKNGDSHFTIEVGNTGAKTITEIGWEYYRRDDGQSSGTQIIEKFRSGELQLHPGERRKLSEQVHRYTDDFIKNFSLDSVRITLVGHEDASGWQRLADRK
jgi:hypothetical protein